MIATLRSEWIKLRTARSNVVLALIAVLVPLTICVLVASFADFDGSDPSDAFNSAVLTPAYITVFLAGCIGVLGIGAEYRHNTIRATFAANPRRSQVLSAKLLLTTALGFVFGGAMCLLCFLVAKLVFAIRGQDVLLSLTDPGEHFAALLGHATLCALFAVCGFGLGAMFRQPAGAIPVLMVWPLVVEPILGGVLSLAFDNAQKWMPFSEGIRLGLIGDVDPFFSRVGAGLYFAAFTAILVSIGWLLVERRDA